MCHRLLRGGANHPPGVRIGPPGRGYLRLEGSLTAEEGQCPRLASAGRLDALVIRALATPRRGWA